MTEVIDEPGPVDYLVVEFAGSDFTGEILPELADLRRRGDRREDRRDDRGDRREDRRDRSF